MRLASQTVSRSSSEPEVFHCRCAAADPLDLSAGQVAESGVLLDVLDAQVERADEAPGDGQVRRGLQRRARRRGVQRVDQHETGPEVGGAPASQLAQVGKVAVVPRRPGPHGVQLGHEAPDRTGRHRRGQAEERRRDDHRAAGLGLAAGCLQLMPAQGQVGGQLERRLTDERAVDGTGMHVAVDLRELARGGEPSSGCTLTCTDAPCGTCTKTCLAVPARDTTQGGTISRQGASSQACRAARASSSVPAATPSAASTAVTVELGTRVCWPRQSQNSVATPWAAASWASAALRSSVTPAILHCPGGRQPRRAGALRQSRPTGPRRRPTGRAPTAGRTGRC